MIRIFRIAEIDKRLYGSFIEHIGLVNDDLKAENSAAKENVKAETIPGSVFDGGIFESKLKKASWNVIRFKV